MPISKNQLLYYTPEQYKAAKANDSALDYALRAGYKLIRHGTYFVLREHDSMVFDSKGNWWWNSMGFKGRAPEFMMYCEGKTFPEVIIELSGTSPLPDVSERGAQKRISDAVTKERPKFVLPARATNMRRLFAYLGKARKLSEQTIRLLVNQKLVYESVFPTANGNEIHNACFVSYDENGKPCAAFERGMASEGTAFKRESPYGDKSHGWIIHGKQPIRLYVFEAAIDAASYIDYHIREDPLNSADYMALGGLAFTPIEKYLARRPDTKEVILALDRDDAGRNATLRFYELLRSKFPHIQITVCFPTAGKDWNNALHWLRATEENVIEITEKKELTP